MRNFLFLDTETTGLDTTANRLLQLSTRLIDPGGTQDYDQLIRPAGFTIPPAAHAIHGISDQVATTQGIPLTQALDAFSQQLERADIVIGHNVDFDLSIIRAEARRVDRNDLIARLEKPNFGTNGGRRAAICTHCLAQDYLRFKKQPASNSAAKLITIYRELFHEELTGAHNAMVDVIACQRIYNFIHAFQLEQGVDFKSDIVFLDD